MNILPKKEDFNSEEEYQNSLEELKRNIEIHNNLHQEVKLSREDDLLLLNSIQDD